MSRKRIAGYLRISVDTEIDRDSTSIENQREIIQKYVEKKFPDCELDFYTDRDRSGYTFEQREDYQKMRPLLMSGYYQILIIKDLSRFSRRNSRGLVELEDLRDAGVRIIAITDSIDYPTHDDWQQIQVKFLINEFPITDASRKVKTVISNRQEDGRWVCAVPFGYYITNTKKMTYAIDERAAETVRKIFELYLDGWGYKKIANYLTEQGIPTPRMLEKERHDADGSGSKIRASSIWAVPSISGILSNDFYIGTLRQKKYTRSRINGPDKRVDDEEHIVKENAHEPIVDFRTFAKVQEQLKARTKSNYRGVKKYDTTYSGFLFCGDCGSPMFSMSRPDLAPAYTCGSYHKHGTKKEVGGCTSHHTRIDVLDTMLKKYVERVMAHSQHMIAELEKGIKDEPQAMATSKSTLETLELELARAREEYKSNTRRRNREISKAEDMIDDPVKLARKIALIDETYDELEAELEAKITSLEKQVEFAAERRNMTIQVNRIAKTALDIFREILEKDKLDKGDLALVVDRITVFDDRIEIKLKADIAMLLETGTISKELLEQSSYVGTAVNFNWDTKSISNAKVVQKAVHQKDKAFSVNVVWEGDPLEIYTEKDGGVIFRKYSPMGDLLELSSQLCQSMAEQAGVAVAVSDRDTIIAVSGAPKKELLEKPCSSALSRLLDQRKVYCYAQSESLVPASEENSKHHICVAAPILCQGDILGGVLLLAEQPTVPTETERKLAQTAAAFLGKQMES